MSPGPVHFQGRLARCVIQNWSHVLSTATRLQRGQVSVQQGRLTEPVPEGTGEYPSPVHLNAPPAPDWGRPSPDQARDIAAEVAGWTPGELPGQLPEQLASWPPGADQPPAGA
jgi:hypothetical protein